MSKAVDPRALQFLTPVREFTVHNATDEPVTITYDAETKTIPPVNEIVYPHPKYPDVSHSARDSQGNWIPGTLLLRDQYDEKEMGEFGEQRSLWSAANAIKHALGIDIKTGAATGNYAKRGLSVLPPNPDPDMVREVRADGRSRYEQWRVAQAREVVNAYDQQNAARARVNMAPIPPGSDYHAAVAILRAHDEHQKDRAKASMEAYDNPYLAEEVAPPDESEATTEEPSIEALVDKLANDPEALRVFKEKYRMWPMGKKQQEA